MLCPVMSSGLSIAAKAAGSFDAASALPATARQVEADRLGEIERIALEGAGIGDDGRALDGRLGKARQHLGGVDQLFQRLHQHHGLARDQRAHHGVVAGQGAGMGERRSLRAGAAAGMHQDDRLLRSRARRASARKRCGSRICSMNSAMTLVRSSSIRTSRKSSVPRSASLPVEIERRRQAPSPARPGARSSHGAALRHDAEGRRPGRRVGATGAQRKAARDR